MKYLRVTVSPKEFGSLAAGVTRFRIMPAGPEIGDVVTFVEVEDSKATGFTLHYHVRHIVTSHLALASGYVAVGFSEAP